MHDNQWNSITTFLSDNFDTFFHAYFFQNINDLDQLTNHH